MIATSVVITAVFLWWESRVAEPILPLDIFRVPSMRIGRRHRLPGRLRDVRRHRLPAGLPPDRARRDPDPVRPDAAPDDPGPHGGDRSFRARDQPIGRYRMFPIAGTALIIVAMLRLSNSRRHHADWAAMFLLLLGIGLGCTMQVVVLAVQNAVDPRQMGVATTTATFLRPMGAPSAPPSSGRS